MSTSSNTDNWPKTGLAGLRAHWRGDLLAGFLVFLIAMPLCLGIAMASGFPPMAGIITAIVGGLLVSRISGSHVTVNGPAAGLIVVVLAAVQSLGEGDMMAGYRHTLAAIVVASVLQIALGLAKAGRLSSFFPAAVVHGMLAAIGIIIMAKQMFVLLGTEPAKDSGILETIAQVPAAIADPNPLVALIGCSGLALMAAWSRVRNRYLAMAPAPLLVVLAGIGLGQHLGLAQAQTAVWFADHAWLPPLAVESGPKFLVAIDHNLLASLVFPDFGKVATVQFWGAVLSIALVGSLESLLSAMAVDKLDPYQRRSDLDKDLTAVGIGNVVAGSIGGLPMIAEIVRSSANVNSGAKTGWANFFHGLLLLLFVALFPAVIASIPLASLAALLVFTGFHLASPREFVKAWAVGKEQLLVFVVTIAAILATDLLVGVFIGVAVKLLLHLAMGVKARHLLAMDFIIRQAGGDAIEVQVNGAFIFSNLAALKSALAKLPPGKTVLFQLNDAYFLDHSAMELLHEFEQSYQSGGGHCQVYGLDYHHPHADHPLAARRIRQNLA